MADHRGLALLLGVLLLPFAHGQTVETYVTDDVYPINDFGTVNIANVISNIWVGAFALTSIIFAVFGLAVAWQWPNPRCFCYRTPYSDLPNAAGSRACCSLYTLNVGFLVAWILLLAIMAVSRDIIRIAICVSFVVVHAFAVGAFRFQFKRKGRPSYPEAETSGLNGGSSAPGVPMYHIPMTTATVGEPAPGVAVPPTWGTYPPPPPQQQPGAAGGAAAAPSGAPGPYGWPGAAPAGAAGCGTGPVPPGQAQQQPYAYGSPYPYGAPASQAMPPLYGGYPPSAGYPPVAGVVAAGTWQQQQPPAFQPQQQQQQQPPATQQRQDPQAGAAASGGERAADAGDALTSQRR